MSTKRNVSKRRERQRIRAVLYEGDRERAREAKQKRRSGHAQGQRRNLAYLPAEILLPYPRFAEYLAEHSGFPPRVKTGSADDAKARLLRLVRMRQNGGRLVLLTLHMRELDNLPLKVEPLITAARAAVRNALESHAPGAVAFDVAVQRGEENDCTHAHIVIPLACLSGDLQVLMLSAPSGKGGGAWHSSLHAVLMDDADEDLARVAGYLSRDPDGRFFLPDDHPDFLQAHEDRLSESGKSPRLSWFKLPKSWK